MKLYISDLHFYHDKLNTDLDKRGFADARQMNDCMIKSWNDKVKGGDYVYVLGDMFATKEADEVNRVLNRLSGKICLIQGNHDVMWLKKEGVNLNRFEWIKDYAEIKETKNRIVIASHYPVFCYNHQYLKDTDGREKTFMLYGHVHNSHDEILVNAFQSLTRRTILKGSEGDRNIPCNMINVFCMFSNYAPLSLDEWIKKDEERRKGIKVPDGFEIKDEL